MTVEMVIVFGRSDSDVREMEVILGERNKGSLQIASVASSVNGESTSNCWSVSTDDEKHFGNSSSDHWISWYGGKTNHLRVGT